MSTSPGNGSIPGFGGNGQPGNIIEEMLLRQRLGQEIPHDGMNTPKRTESLYISPARKKEKVRGHGWELGIAEKTSAVMFVNAVGGTTGRPSG